MNFSEYYKHYLSLHQNKWCRRLHVLGQLGTILYLFLFVYLAVTTNWLFALMLVFTPFVVYIFAWSGHFFFEHNKPAAFGNPWMAKLADWRMLFDILSGKIPF